MESLWPPRASVSTTYTHSGLFCKTLVLHSHGINRECPGSWLTTVSGNLFHLLASSGQNGMPWEYSRWIHFFLGGGSANATKEPKGIYDLWLTNYTVENQVENYYIVKKRKKKGSNLKMFNSWRMITWSWSQIHKILCSHLRGCGRRLKTVHLYSAFVLNSCFV